MQALKSIAVRCLPGVVVVMGLALLTACSGAAPGTDAATTLTPAANGAPAADAQTTQPAPAGLGRPPVDEYVDPAEIIARRGSVTGQFTRIGEDSFATTSNNVPDGHNLMLEPGPENLAWAMYRFGENVAGDSPFVVSLELQYPLPDQLYIGVADYAQGAWNWQILDEPRARTYLGLPGLLQPVSPGGNIHVTVLSQGEVAVISALTLYRDTVAPPPVNLRTAVEGPYPDRIVLNWDDPAVTYPGLSYILVYVERETADGSWLLLDYVPAGTTTFEDVCAEGNELPYNTDCHYRIRTNVYGDLSMAGPICTGRRVLRDVAGLTATAGSYPDRISLVWQPVTEADGYLLEVNVDDAWHEVARIGAGETCAYEHVWDETPGATVPFDTPTEYRVSGLWQEYTSTGYATAIGRRGLGDAYHVEASAGTYPDQVLVSWGKVKDATGYEIGYGTSAGEIQSLAVLDGNANTEFTHTFETPVGKECALDTEYYYWVRGRFGDDPMSLDDQGFVTGYRAVNPPESVWATQGTSPDEITVKWWERPHMTGYQIYRDGTEPEHLIAEVGAVRSLVDPVEDFYTHKYWIRSVWQDELSDFSDYGYGYRNLYRLHLVSNEGYDYPELEEINGAPVIVSKEPAGLTFWRATKSEPVSAEDWDSHLVKPIDTPFEFSLTLIDGNPAIAVSEETETGAEVTYFRATVPLPGDAGDWESHLITDTSAECLRPELQSVGGLPALCFADGGNRFARALTTQPSSIADWVVCDPPGDGYFPTLIEYQGRPVFTIAAEQTYQESTLKMVQGLTGTPTTVEDWTSVSLGQGRPYCSLAEVDGRLAIGFYRNLNDNCYGWSLADLPTHTSDWRISKIGTGNISYYSGGERLVEYQGCPAICYRAAGDLSLARATVPRPDGADDWETFRVASSVYGLPTLRVVNDKLALAFCGSRTVKYGVAQE